MSNILDNEYYKLRKDYDVVSETMKSVDRGKYCKNGEMLCYKDSPSPIGNDQTISAPHMHFYALEKSVSVLEKAILNQEEGESPIEIADIGSGSGYLTVAYRVLMDKLKEKLEKNGKSPRRHGNVRVFGMELISDLVKFANDNFKSDKMNYDRYRDSIEFIRKSGYELDEIERYDVIHVGAAAENEAPKGLIRALKTTGILIIPIKDSDGREYMNLVTKDEKGLPKYEKDISVRYVPLVNG